MAFSKHLGWTLALLIPSVALAGAQASSFKKENKKGANYWNAQSALDGDKKTAWMLPGDSANLAEWIRIEVPPSTVDRIGIWPGWGKSDEHFKDYARVKKLKVEYLCCRGDDEIKTMGSQTVDVADENSLQWIDLDDRKIGNELFGGFVKLTVLEIYKGKDFPNLAISEVVVGLTEFPAAGVDMEPSGEHPDHIIMDAQDDNKKTFWAVAAEGASVDLSSDTFGLSSVDITAGPKTHARPKTVKVTVQQRSRTQVLEDIPGPQNVTIPALTGYSGSGFGAVTLEFLDFYEGSKTQELAVSELAVNASNTDGM